MADTSDARLEVVLEAKIDKLSAQLSKANQTIGGWAAKTQKQLEETNNSFGKLFGKAEPGKALDNVFSRARLGVLEEGATKISIFGSALEELGPAGLGAAAGLAALGLAAEAARKAMEWADDLDRTSKALGVTTTGLQELDYASVASSIGLEKGREAMATFNEEIGKFETHTGDKRLQKWAEAIGLTRQEVNQTVDPIQKLALVMDHIAELSDAQSRASAAKAFGLDALLPIINQGKEGIEEFLGKMREAKAVGGVINPEDIKNAAELNDKVEALSYLIEQHFRQAFIEAAPAIEAVAAFLERCTKALADFAGNIPNAVRGLSDLLHLMPKGGEGGGEAAKGGGLPIPMGDGPLDIAGRAASLGWQYLTQRGQTAKLSSKIQDMLSGKPVDLTGSDFDPILGRQGQGKQIGQDKPKDDENAKALLDAKKDELSAELALTGDLDKQHDLKTQLLAIEARIKEQALKKLLREGKITQDTYDRAKAEEGLAANAKQQLEDRNADLALDKKLLDAAGEYSDLRNRQLAAEAQMTPIASRRADLELEIFKYKQAQAYLEYEYAEKLKLRNGSIDAGQYDENLATFRKTQNAELTAERQRQNEAANPVVKYLQNIQDLNYEMQTAGVQAAKSLSDGLANAIVNAKSLGDVVSSVFRQLIAQILSAVIQKSIAGPILGALGIPGFAGGTNFAPGGLALVGENGPELVDLARGSKVIPNGMLSSLASLSPASRGASVVQQFSADFRGAVVTEDLLASFKSYVDDARQQATIAGANLGQKQAVASLRRQQRNRLG